MSATKGVAVPDTLPRNNPRALHWINRRDRDVAVEVGTTHVAALCGFPFPLANLHIVSGTSGAGRGRRCARCEWLYGRLPE